MTVHKQYVLQHLDDVHILLESAKNALDEDDPREGDVWLHLHKAQKQARRAVKLAKRLSDG